MPDSGEMVRWILFLILIITAIFSIPGWTDAGRRSGRPVNTYSLFENNSRTGLAAADRSTKARVSEAYGKLPLRFEANDGQVSPEVKFVSRGRGYNLFLTPAEATLALRPEKTPGRPGSQSIVRMKFNGANPAPRIEGLEVLPNRSHYFIGNDPGRWRRNVKSYARVRYRSLYPGIDLVYYGRRQELEYDFVVAPGAAPEAIKLWFQGVERIEVDRQGDLVLQTAAREVRQRRPVTYQQIKGQRREIGCRYVVTGSRQVGFELAPYDRTQPLVIDPVMAYSTVLGGFDSDFGENIAVDASGNAYLTGSTFSADFPTVNPLQPAPGGAFSPDLFVAKLNREGSALIYSTYLGGSSYDQGLDIAVDGSGNAYVTGSTYSSDFPTRNPLQPAPAGTNQEAFLAKLNADGSTLIYSTYLGGRGPDQAFGLAVNNLGEAYLTGITRSNDFPTRNALQPASGGAADAFVARVNAAGSALIYSTYLGGSGDDQGNDLVVDRLGNVYLTGMTVSRNFPTAGPLQSAISESNPPPFFVPPDVFVTKLAADGVALTYSTYFGGTGGDEGKAIAVDAAGNAYVTGSTGSSDLPLRTPWQSTLKGYANAFVTKLNQTGSALVYSTYLGGNRGDMATGIAVDSQGRVSVTGQTTSTDFPTVDAVQPMPDDPYPIDIFLSKLKADGSGLIYSTYLGGNSLELNSELTLDARGNTYVIVTGYSSDFPTTPDAFQKEPRAPGNNDAFVIKIIDGLAHPAPNPLDDQGPRLSTGDQR
ncbi:MAG TPA: SBBP repeat-containing protein [Blastocatellia bacterium]|nr:SBBP repeat-containing protein [Blastocatellia bacterium]